MEPDPPTPPGSSTPPASSEPGAPGPQDDPPLSTVPDPPAVPEPRDKVSVAAFVLSLFGVGIAAIPLGIWGVVRTSRGPRRGRGFAISALAISAVWAAATAVAMAALVGGGGLAQVEALASPAVATSTEPPATGTAPPATAAPATATASGTSAPTTGGPLAKPKKVYWQDLEPGMCLNNPAAEALNVPVVDCRSAHEYEVIARGKLKGNRTWPGDDAVDKAAQAQCEPAFAAYVGLPWDDSRLDLDFFTTVQEGWEAGDRRLICMVYDPEDLSSTGSFRGSQE